METKPNETKSGLLPLISSSQLTDLVYSTATKTYTGHLTVQLSSSDCVSKKDPTFTLYKN